MGLNETLRTGTAGGDLLTAHPFVETGWPVRGPRRVNVPYMWVRGASLTVSRDLGPSRRRVSIHVLPPRGDMPRQVDDFIRERVASKGPQLTPWGRGILVTVHGSSETADDVAAGIARFGEVPWWRVYWVGPSPDQVHLVAG